MKRGIKITLYTAAVALIAAAVAFGWLFGKAIPIGTGFVAKYICSSTFISKRDPGIVFREDVAPVNPLARIVSYSIDRQQKSVTADAFGLFGLSAVYREGCGCSLVIGTTAEKMAAQKLVPPDFIQNLSMISMR